MKMKKILTIILSIIVAVSFNGCKATQNTEPQDDARIKIVTTLFPYYDFVRAVTKGVDGISINKENIDLIANYEVSSSSIMKRLVLNDIGIGFTNVENLKDIKDKIIIINKIEIEDTKEGIATLKKNMSNKATIELVKEIKRYYKQN